jgi:hypothetical protein
MNNNLEKLCRFLIGNRVSDKDLVVGFDENLVIYKDYEWDLERDEVEISDFRPFDCAKLKITDIDEYKLTIFEDGSIEVETPEEKEGSWLSLEEAIDEIDRLLEVNKDLAKRCELLEQTNKIDKFLKSYGVGNLGEAIEHFKSIQDYAKLCNKVYLNTMLTGVR